MHPRSHLAACSLTFLLASSACGATDDEPARAGAPRERADGGPRDSGGDAAPSFGLEGGPLGDVVAPRDNPLTKEKAALGRLLFYDPIVSVDGQVACATCHSEVWGMGDGLPVSIGQGGGLLSGPGRTGPHRTRRNAPSLWNAGYRATLFWDGRASSLEDQVHFPFEQADELDRPLAQVVADLRQIPTYVTLFREAFPGLAAPVSELTFAAAVASFERTLVSRRGLYDTFVAGDPLSLSAGMRRGMALFGDEGCIDCHRPPLFASERFEDRHVPALPAADEGRFEATGNDADRGRFQVPSLRNAQDTAPYFHTGGAATIDEAVRHEVNESVTRNGAPPLSDAQVADLTLFVRKALVDSQHSPTRPDEVPSGLPVPIDGFSIRR